MRSSRLAFLALSTLIAAPSFGSLVGYWDFDEGGGTLVADFSGHGHDGVLVNQLPTTWTLGPSSGAIYFDGTLGPAGTRVEVNDSLMLRLANQATFAAWIRCDNIGRDAPILAKEGPGGALSYWFGVFGLSSAGHWGGLLDQDGWQGWDFNGRDQGSLPQGRWVHVAMTWNGSTATFYTNGTPTNALNWGGTIHASNARLFFGMNSEYTFQSNRTAFHGAVDEIHVYDHELLASDVFRLASAVHGHVELQDFVGSAAGQVIEVEFLQDGSVADKQTSVLDADGNYLVHTDLSGLALVWVKPTHWLARFVSPVVLGGQIELAAISVVNGDCDGDNEIGIGDYSLLSYAYGSTVGDPKWSAAADLNGDESVDIADYAVLSYNYGAIGDD